AGDAVRPETPARRAPPPVALGVPADSDVIAKILERPSDPGVAPSGELIAQRDGSYVKDDLMFVAAVEPDGTVHFDDKPNFNYKFHLPIPTPSQVKHHLAHWVEDPYGGAVGQYASVNRDGTDDDNDGKLDEGQTVRVLSGGFDVTDWVMRSHGEDPYSSRKLAFLDRTRDERVQIGQVYRTRQLEAADQYMLAHLTKLWRRDDLDAAARREAIFELWDDCAETGEEAVVAAAVRARAALLRFVDVTLPRGSDDAFTDDEVARFNARRRSAATFAPYP
ncbi:MAG: hypothetical protein KC464_30590, partial [Myxococcales bacterium]|nr:hypothetical protein [Myxococcales bacterium]